jgi:hypothetical protein
VATCNIAITPDARNPAKPKSGALLNFTFNPPVSVPPCHYRVTASGADVVQHSPAGCAIRLTSGKAELTVEVSCPAVAANPDAGEPGSPACSRTYTVPIGEPFWRRFLNCFWECIRRHSARDSTSTAVVLLMLGLFGAIDGALIGGFIAGPFGAISGAAFGFLVGFFGIPTAVVVYCAVTCFFESM